MKIERLTGTPPGPQLYLLRNDNLLYLGEILLNLAAQKMGRGRSDRGKIVINKCRESFTLDCLSSDCDKILRTVNY